MATRKWLTGCLVATLVLAGIAVATWVFLVRPYWVAAIDEAKAWVSSVDLGDDIRNQAPYAAPADGRLTREQVAKFVQVQQRIAEAMGNDLSVLVEEAQAVADEHGGQLPGREASALLRDTQALMARIRKAQSDAINETGMSRDEFAFVRRQAMAALPRLVTPSELRDMPGINRIAFPRDDDQAAQDAARHNAELLRSHAPLLRQSLGFGVGLP